ncbi:MAG: HEAT repeat domain-containing protein [Bacillota bacterium]
MLAQAATEPAATNQAAVAPATTPAPIAPELAQTAEDFWHYASIARYDLAKAAGEKILGMSAEPMAVYNAFEAVVADKNRRVVAEKRVELYERLLAWQRVAELKDVSAKLLTVFNKAKYTRRADTAFIETNIQRLIVNRRAYELAMQQLRQSGELSVPIMLNYLRDPAKKQYYVAIRSALRDLGIKALNPLLAATEMKDWNTLLWVVSALGDIGYDNAVPYLVRLTQSKETPQAVKEAAAQSLLRLNVSNPRELNAAQLFYELAEKFYYEKASIVPEPGSDAGFMWSWTEAGLSKKNVPAVVFNEDMALRACEYALRLDSSRGDAVSLWLASAYKREVELPQGAADPMWEQDHAATHFYAVHAGTQHLNPVLDRAIRDRNSEIALKAIKSLQEIAGSSSLFTGEENHPILAALRYPDRQVRFEAAFTVAQALPQKAFAGQDRVVPILSEALAQTGKPGVLLVGRSQDQINSLKGKLGQAYHVEGATTAEAAVNAAANMSGVDIVVVNEDHPQIDRLFSEVRDNVRLAGAGMLIRVASEAASPFAALAQTNPLISVTAAKDETLAAVVEAARKRAGGLPTDEQVATSYALRSAELLGKLALCRGQVLDLSVAQGTILAALNDARVEVIKAAGNVLALYSTREAQAGLFDKAMDDKTAGDLKVLLFKDLSTNAKFFGNLLDQERIDALTKLVATAGDATVRSAAAEAHGALNLPADQVKTLILQQSKK